MKLKYIENTNFLSKDEWTELINYLINKIKETKIGNTLIENLEKVNNLTICNYCSSKNFQYPHYNYLNNTVYIPDTPYFINVPVLNDKLYQNDSELFLQNIFNAVPLDNKLSKEFIECFSIYKFQPYYIILFHELVHCLRRFENVDNHFSVEEESTIYGLKNNTLILNQIIITENSFRKELGLLPRLSHDSNDKYIYNVTNKNYENETLKSLFYQ